MTTSERLDYIRGEITALKSLLRDTDYSSNKLVENLSDCETMEEVFSACQAHHNRYADVIASRREWRKKINELEAEEEEIIGQLEAEEAAAAEHPEETSDAEEIPEVEEIELPEIEEVPVTEEETEVIVDAEPEETEEDPAPETDGE